MSNRNQYINYKLKKARETAEKLQKQFDIRAKKCRIKERKFSVVDAYRKDICFKGGLVKRGTSKP